MSKGITVFVKIDKVGSKCEVFLSWEDLGVTEQEFDSMSSGEQDSLLCEIANIDWGFYKVKENEQNT